MVAYIIMAVIAYLIGSINFSVIISKKMAGFDVREKGSGNAGTTNMLRSYGKKAAIMTLLGDMLKTVAACMFGALMGPEYYGMYIAGLFCIMGHMFPVFFKFRGGKGVACLAMMVLITDWRVFLFLLFTFLVLVLGTKYVSLGSVICAMIYPIVLNRMNKTVPFGWLIALLVGALIVFMHRENIKRLLTGTERKTYLFKKNKVE